MTRRISLVAVCCSRASVSARLRASELLEQPHVLDRDDRLLGEGLEQLDLLVGEGPGSARADDDHADRRARRAASGRRDAAVSARARATRVRITRGSSLDVGDRGRPRRSSTARPDESRGPAVLERPAGCLEHLPAMRRERARWISSPSKRKTAADCASHSRSRSPRWCRTPAARRSASSRSRAGSRWSPSAAPAPR